MTIRNILFASGFLECKQHKTPTVGVGNLSMGGTGKSVVIDYLINTLKRKYKTATLSRGYGRSSKGFVLANSNATAENIAAVFELLAAAPPSRWPDHPERL